MVIVMKKGEKRGDGLLVVRIVLAQIALMTIVVGLLYLAGMFGAAVDGELDPVTGMPGPGYQEGFP